MTTKVHVAEPLTETNMFFVEPTRSEPRSLPDLILALEALLTPSTAKMQGVRKKRRVTLATIASNAITPVSDVSDIVETSVIAHALTINAPSYSAGGAPITMDAGSAGFGTFDPFPPSSGSSRSTILAAV